jgi:ABC-type multidrug transport system ATPase subunit
MINIMSNCQMTQAHNNQILQANKLHFSYPNHQLFSNFSANIPPGITLVRGGDGRGKSTLLRLLAGVLPVQSGQLQINGIDLQRQPENYKAQVFWAEPRSDAFDQLSVPDYFELQRRSHASFNEAVMADVVAGLGLSEHLYKQLFMLSTGSKRKVFIAAACASGAALTLFDEPFAAVDAASIGFILKWLKDAASINNRAWVVADYVAPDGLPLAQIIDLGD